MSVAYTVTLHVAVTFCNAKIPGRIDFTGVPGVGLLILNYVNYTPGDNQRECQVFFKQCDETNQREKTVFGHGCFFFFRVCLLVFLLNFDLFAH